MDILDLNPGDRVTIDGDAWPGEHLITRIDTELEVVYVGEGVDDPIPAHQVTAKVGTRCLLTALRESLREAERLRQDAREARNAT